VPRFLIERDLPGAGSLTADEVHLVAAKSVEVLADMQPRAQWVQSYVASDKVYCLYLADDEATLRDHAQRVGVPLSAVNQVTSVIDPTTGE
jgi:Protein of unknown function (DUF4242)